MTNDELNKKIAELRGWRIEYIEDQDITVLYTPEIESISVTNGVLTKKTRTIYDKGKYELSHFMIPNYCTDWKFASRLLRSLFTSKHLVNFSNGDTDSYDIDIQTLDIHVSCDTPQRAIAEAWKAWKERE